MKKQSGFGLVAAIFILVILASLGAAMVNFGAVQQTTSAQDILSAKAWQAARAGNEWGLFQALRGTWTACTNETQTLDLTADTGFRVTVNCTSTVFNEGETASGTRTVRIFRILSTACNSSSSCPDDASASSLGYIERVREVIATN
ncbi:MAG TPA: MSHA biogenesis protein MshP [Noviherbaspirillum sp.]|nr:MSHA biogenesis protein MshP [Noviherbaspirillum sp.]